MEFAQSSSTQHFPGFDSDFQLAPLSLGGFASELLPDASFDNAHGSWSTAVLAPVSPGRTDFDLPPARSLSGGFAMSASAPPLTVLSRPVSADQADLPELPESPENGPADPLATVGRSESGGSSPPPLTEVKSVAAAPHGTKRKRPAGATCGRCYAHKVKCSGQRPCDRCVQRGQADICKDRQPTDVRGDVPNKKQRREASTSLSVISEAPYMNAHFTNSVMHTNASLADVLPALDKLYSMMPKESFEDRFPYFAGFLHATRLRGTEGRSLGAKAIDYEWLSMSWRTLPKTKVYQETFSPVAMLIKERIHIERLTPLDPSECLKQATTVVGGSGVYQQPALLTAGAGATTAAASDLFAPFHTGAMPDLAPGGASGSSASVSSSVASTLSDAAMQAFPELKLSSQSSGPTLQQLQQMAIEQKVLGTLSLPAPVGATASASTSASASSLSAGSAAGGAGAVKLFGAGQYLIEGGIMPKFRTPMEGGRVIDRYSLCSTGYINPDWEKLVGYSNAELQDLVVNFGINPVFNIPTANHQQIASMCIKTFFGSEKDFRILCPIITRDGTAVPCVISCRVTASPKDGLFQKAVFAAMPLPLTS